MGGSSKAQTVGYRYSLGMHMGISHGPVDALLEIRVGDRTAWSGSATSNSTIAVTAPQLFGGDEREGGVDGALDVMMGGDDQATNSYLAAMQGGAQPAYRGLFGVVYRGLVTSNNPYLKAWAFRVRRILRGWRGGAPWYSGKAEVIVDGGVVAMNPAHIVYECLTNTEWGMGEPPGRLDDDSFRAAADAFYSEGMGLCLQFVRQGPVQDFIQEVVNHCGAVLVEDRRTGLFKLKAIRGGYDVGALPTFSDDLGNVMRLERFDRAGYTGTVNELTVTYADAATGKDGSVTVQNLAAVQAQGVVEPEARQYPGLPTSQLAARTAMRDLRSASSGLARATVVLNQSAWAIEPGDVIAFSWSPLGIVSIPLRVARVNYGTLVNGEVRVEAAEDVFGLPLSSYVAPQPSGWLEPDNSPKPSASAAAFEAPYRDLVQTIGRAEAQALPVDTGYVGVVAKRPSGLALDFQVHTRVGAAAYEQRGTGAWTPMGELSLAYGPTATNLVLTGGVDLAYVSMGTAALIGEGVTAEAVSVASVDPGAGAVTVARGCLDTVPRSWPIGTRVWFYDLFAGDDSTEYVAGETVNAKAVTRSPGGTLDVALAPAASVTMNGRAARPYPPGGLMLNGVRYPSSISGELVVSWSHRDRILQDDQLVDSLQGNIGPEPGTSYTLQLYDETGALRRQVTGLTGTSYVWSTESADSGLGTGAVRALLHLDGANLSTTITDEVGNAWVASGAAAISTADSKFGGASLALDGSGSYVGSTASLSNYVFGTGDFTIELWIKTTKSTCVPLDFYGTGVYGWQIYINAGKVTFYTVSAVATGLTTVTDGNWHHIAVARSGNTLRIFVDGNVDATATITQDLNFQASVIAVGAQVHIRNPAYDVNGFIDEVRITKGLAQYTAPFTPQTSAHPPPPPGRLNDNVRIVLFSVRDGLESWQYHDLSVIRT